MVKKCCSKAAQITPIFALFEQVLAELFPFLRGYVCKVNIIAV